MAEKSGADQQKPSTGPEGLLVANIHNQVSDLLEFFKKPDASKAQLKKLIRPVISNFRQGAMSKDDVEQHEDEMNAAFFKLDELIDLSQLKQAKALRGSMIKELKRLGFEIVELPEETEDEDSEPAEVTQSTEPAKGPEPVEGDEGVKSTDKTEDKNIDIDQQMFGPIQQKPRSLGAAANTDKHPDQDKQAAEDKPSREALAEYRKAQAAAEKDPKEAIKHCDAAIAMFPNFNRAKELKERLENPPASSEPAASEPKKKKANSKKKASKKKKQTVGSDRNATQKKHAPDKKQKLTRREKLMQSENEFVKRSRDYILKAYELVTGDQDEIKNPTDPKQVADRNSMWDELRNRNKKALNNVFRFGIHKEEIMAAITQLPETKLSHGRGKDMTADEQKVVRLAEVIKDLWKKQSQELTKAKAIVAKKRKEAAPDQKKKKTKERKAAARQRKRIDEIVNPPKPTVETRHGASDKKAVTQKKEDGPKVTPLTPPSLDEVMKAPSTKELRNVVMKSKDLELLRKQIRSLWMRFSNGEKVLANTPEGSASRAQFEKMYNRLKKSKNPLVTSKSFEALLDGYIKEIVNAKFKAWDPEKTEAEFMRAIKAAMEAVIKFIHRIKKQ